MNTRLKDMRRLTGLPETIEVCLQAPKPITTTKFNPFGTILASGSSTGDIILWAWSTRGIARTFSDGHTRAITSLLWSSDGRQLASASLDGSLVIWDVLSGSKLISKQFDRGGILHIGAVVPSTTTTASDKSDTRNESWLQKLDDVPLVVSFEDKEALIINFKDGLNGPNTSVPVAALEGPTRTARLLTGAAAAATGQCIATSPCGRYIASAARGVVCLLSAENSLKVLDAVKIKGVPKKIKTMSFDSTGKQLLIGTTDRFVRIYNISTSGTSSSTTEEENKAKKVVDVENLVNLAGEHFIAEGSLIHQEASQPLQNKPTTATDDVEIPSLSSLVVVQLKLSRLFDAQVEQKLSWGACAFSPDGEHLVSAIDASSNEHVIYTWNIFHGYAENTLQAGSDGIVELTWHPEPAPMQCLAVGKSGKMYIWAKVMTQDWSAFAPDFETLTDNREHIEEETEFDVELVKEEEEGAGVAEGEDVEETGKRKNKKKAAGGVGKKIKSTGDVSNKASVEDEEIDIESWDWLGTSSNDVWKSGWSAASTTGPLLHLPVIWPTEPVEEDGVENEEEEEEIVPEEQEVEEAVPMAVDGEGPQVDGGEVQENVDGVEDKDEDAEGASKKARIE